MQLTACDGCSSLLTRQHLELGKTQVAGYTYGEFFKLNRLKGVRSTFNLHLLRWEDNTLNLGYPFRWQYIRDMEEESLLFACACWQVHSFMGGRAYFFGILANTEDQLRHPTLWTEQLLDLRTFSW